MATENLTPYERGVTVASESINGQRLSGLMWHGWRVSRTTRPTPFADACAAGIGHFGMILGMHVK